MASWKFPHYVCNCFLFITEKHGFLQPLIYLSDKLPQGEINNQPDVLGM